MHYKAQCGADEYKDVAKEKSLSQNRALLLIICRDALLLTLFAKTVVYFISKA